MVIVNCGVQGAEEDQGRLLCSLFSARSSRLYLVQHPGCAQGVGVPFRDLGLHWFLPGPSAGGFLEDSRGHLKSPL